MRQFFKVRDRRCIINVGALVPSGWTPAEILTEGWYDASDLSTITEVASYVSQLDDKSGKGRHVVQASGALQPRTGLRTQNSLDMIEGDGTQWIGLNPFPLNADGNVSVFGVFVIDNVTYFSEGIFAMDGSGADFKFCASPSGYNGPDFRGFVQGGFGTNLTLTGYPFNGPSIYNAEFDKTGSGFVTARIDGIDRAQQTYATGLATSMNFTILADKAAQFMVDGAFGEVVVVHNDLTQATRQKIEGYLAWKWGGL